MNVLQAEKLLILTLSLNYNYLCLQSLNVFCRLQSQNNSILIEFKKSKNMDIYGILDKNNCHIDISKSERGAKIYATKHGYDKVSIRYNCGYNVRIISVKVKNKWINQ